MSINGQDLALVDEFPDWLSPLLVKDLRRALRQRAFVITFLSLVGVKSLLFTTLILEGANGDDFLGTWVWMPITLILLGLQPLRGLNAIVEERKLDTLQLMQVTGMSSFRILFGKWASLGAQSWLFAVVLVPYLVLMHFLGGVEFFGQLLALFFLVLQSLIITAVAVSLSAIQSIIARIVVGVLLVIFGSLLFSVPLMIANSLFFAQGGIELLQMLIFMTFGSVYLIYLILCFGAYQLGIVGSENYSSIRRILALSFVLLLVSAMLWRGLVSGASFESREFFISGIFLGLFWAMMAIDCLTDPYLPEDKKMGKLRRLPRVLAWVFTPGWPKGWLLCLGSFLLLLGALCLQASWWQDGITPQEVDTLVKGIIAAMSVFSLVALPAWLPLRMEREKGTLLGLYLALQLPLLFFSAIFINLLSTITEKNIYLALVPVTNLFYIYSNAYEMSWALISSLAYFLLTCTLFFFRASKVQI